jgi:hypothetical protein
MLGIGISICFLDKLPSVFHFCFMILKINRIRYFPFQVMRTQTVNFDAVGHEMTNEQWEGPFNSHIFFYGPCHHQLKMSAADGIDGISLLLLICLLLCRCRLSFPLVATSELVDFWLKIHRDHLTYHWANLQGLIELRDIEQNEFLPFALIHICVKMEGKYIGSMPELTRSLSSVSTL